MADVAVVRLCAGHGNGNPMTTPGSTPCVKCRDTGIIPGSIPALDQHCDCKDTPTPVDISPEAVELLAEWCESGGRQCPTALRPSAMLRALRSALTAAEQRIAELSRPCWREDDVEHPCGRSES